MKLAFFFLKTLSFFDDYILRFHYLRKGTLDQFKSFTVLDSLFDAAIVIGHNGDLCYCNDSFSSLCEIPLKQILKKKNLKELLTFTPDELLNPKSLDKLDLACPYEEITYVSASQKSGRAQISMQPILDSSGQKKILIFLHDVSLEERLQSKYRSELSQKDKKIFEISLLLDVSNALTAISDINSVYESVVDKILSHNFCDFICHIQFLQGKTSLAKIYRPGTDPETLEFPKTVPVEIDDLSKSRTVQIFTKEKHSSFFSFFGAKTKIDSQTHAALLPIRTLKLSGGVFLFFKSGPVPDYTPEDLHLLKSIASQAGVALESARFFENSITDEMTGLFNKRFFLKRLEGEIDRAERAAKRLSFVIFDIDHFKLVNDKFGHQAGDYVLTEVAKAAKGLCRKYDVAARYGGEEFVLILPDSDAPGASLMEERLRKKIEEAVVKFNGKDISVTVSLGIATYPDQGGDVDTVISLADKALYFAKGAGRNQTKVYGPDCELGSSNKKAAIKLSKSG